MNPLLKKISLVVFCFCFALAVFNLIIVLIVYFPYQAAAWTWLRPLHCILFPYYNLLGAVSAVLGFAIVLYVAASNKPNYVKFLRISLISFVSSVIVFCFNPMTSMAAFSTFMVGTQHTGNILFPLFHAVRGMDENSTRYAPGFTWQKFKEIKDGQTYEEVLRRMGEPLRSFESKSGRIIEYSTQNKSSDSYWQTVVRFSEGQRVKGVTISFYFD